MIFWLLLWAAQAAPEPKSETIRIPDSTFSFDMVRIPGGKVKVGNPAREIELKPFWISRHEVSWEAFEKYFTNRKATTVDGITRPSQPYEPPNGPMGTGTHPAVGMRWHGAMGYCEWLSRTTERRFRLPTEAEWELAARAGETGAAPAGAADLAWCKENAGEKTHAAGGKKPNAFGLHDMLGNVWEYCLEPYSPPEFGPVLRGGAWHTPAAGLSFVHRQIVNPEWYDRDPNRPRSMWWLTDGHFIGFRLAQFVDPAGKAAQEAYAAKVEVGELKILSTKGGNARVAGSIRNAGDRALDEVELVVSYLDAKGRPVLQDNKVRPGYSKHYPVIVNGFHDGPARKPLGPGETRAFEVDIPVPYDLDEDAEKAGARVNALQFSKP